MPNIIAATEKMRERLEVMAVCGTGAPKWLGAARVFAGAP
jgi:hypothetical protein